MDSEVLPSQDISNDSDIIIDKIFATTEWKQEIEKLGLSVVFIGTSAATARTPARPHFSTRAAMEL
jgi:hypothetical protein